LRNLAPQLVRRASIGFAPDVSQDAKADATRSERVYAQRANLSNHPTI